MSVLEWKEKKSVKDLFIPNSNSFPEWSKASITVGIELIQATFIQYRWETWSQIVKELYATEQMKPGKMPQLTPEEITGGREVLWGR